MPVIPTSDQQYDKVALWRGQGYHESTRLHLQNWIWTHQAGYALHPKVCIPKEKPIRIADVACSNGSWILDLAPQYPNATFDGLDLSPNNFPAPAWRLPNCNFHVWDASSEVPAEFVGVFDVVHIRAFYSIIVENQTEPYLSNVLKLLRPGGYLQWDEADMPTLSCSAPAGVSAKATQKIVDFNLKVMIHSNKLTPDWLYGLASTLESKGCRVLAEDRIKPRPEFQRAWCDNWLTAFGGLGARMPEKPDQPGMFSRQEFADLLLESAEECQKGAWYHHDVIIFVAKKGE